MRELVPFTGLTSLRREMDRLFDRFFDGEASEIPAFGDWMPRVDITDKEDKVTVKAEIPGIDAKKIEVSVQDQTLTIKGEKQHEKEEKGEHCYRTERSYGAFARTLRLPTAVDPSNAEATSKDGVLTITIAKAAGAKGKTIPVKEAA